MNNGPHTNNYITIIDLYDINIYLYNLQHHRAYSRLCVLLVSISREVSVF